MGDDEYAGRVTAVRKHFASALVGQIAAIEEQWLPPDPYDY
jgi:hypothetical protein